MQTTDPNSLDDIFTVRTANEWIRTSRLRPKPTQLFGDMWLEGELAILFADTGAGKSLLAVQIAESIARARAIYPFPRPVGRRQKVLYFDFELTDKQFEMRYAPEPDAEGAAMLRDHYRFSDEVFRIQVNMQAEVPNGHASFEEFLLCSIERLVCERGVRAVIIDNITYLKRGSESMRGAVTLMQQLKRLKAEYGISILVLAHTPKRDTTRPITANNLQGSKALSNFADNIFAIGESRQDTRHRYIKQVKARSAEAVFNQAHVPVFRITKIGGKFLGFEFVNFAAESLHLEDVRDRREWQYINYIKQQSDAGRAIRSIAEELKMGKSTVHRLLQIWQPPRYARHFNENCKMLRREQEGKGNDLDIPIPRPAFEPII